MPFSPVYISAYDCLSPAGEGLHVLLSAMKESRTFLRNGIGELPSELSRGIESLRAEKSLKDQDRVTLMGVYLANRFRELGRSTGVIVGSSRGAAASIEEAIESQKEGKRLRPSTSPVTTASSLPSAIARHLSLEGPSFSLSAACSTGLYAVIQGATNLNAGLAESFLVGGAEAANTRFTREMMSAAKVISKSDDLYPCMPFAEERSGMVLSEGAALLHISQAQTSSFAITGVGAATESSTLTGITKHGIALQSAIRMALSSSMIAVEDVDLLVAHGSGTVKGDEAELSAYESIFGDKIPPLVCHKWCGGHMLGASSALSVMLSVEHLRSSVIPPHPYFHGNHPMRFSRRLPRARHALVASMGFGGSAAAIIVSNLMA